jgi:hypothetical protein
MFGFLRRHQPDNPILAVLFWIALMVIALVGLFVVFYLLEDVLPGAGPLDDPGV